MATNTKTNPVDGGNTEIDRETAQAPDVRSGMSDDSGGQPESTGGENAGTKEVKADEATTGTNPKVKETADKEAGTKAALKNAVREALTESGKEREAFIAPYRKAYPGEKAFIVTSDKQVFLEKDRSLAVLHQNSLQNGEKVQTIKVK